MDTVIVFAGGDIPTPDIVEHLPDPDLVVAADGGYRVALALGQHVDVVVGDFDSLEPSDLPDQVVVERHSPDKDQTDLELAIVRALEESPDRLVVVGGSGGRIDHEQAVVSVICSPRLASVQEVDWISGRARAHVIRRRRLIHGEIGNIISLIPIGGDTSGTTTTGLRWNLDDETLRWDRSRGISNVFEASTARIEVDSGVLLAVLPV